MIRIGLVGDHTVGKQTLIERFVSGHFIQEHDVGIEDVHEKVVTLPPFQSSSSTSDSPTFIARLEQQEGLYTLKIIFNINQGEFPGHYDTWLTSMDAYLVVFSINRRESLDVANNTIEKIKDKKECEKKAIILCANKYDLSSESVITYKDGIKLAQLYDIPYVETSAKTGKNVEHAIIDLVRSYYNNIQ